MTCRSRSIWKEGGMAGREKPNAHLSEASLSGKGTEAGYSISGNRCHHLRSFVVSPSLNRLNSIWISS
jgi:hypothetical protein